MYYKLKNKKGLSEVIALVLIISIVVVALGILWMFVRPILDFSPQLSCTELQIQNPIEAIEVCYDKDGTGKVMARLKRNFANVDIFTMSFTLSSSQNELNYICDGPNGVSCGENCLILSQGESRKYYFNVDRLKESPEKLLLSANGCVIQNIEVSSSCE